MPKMFSNVLFYLQFGFYIVELLENYLFHAFMRSVHLTRSVRLYLPSPTSALTVHSISLAARPGWPREN